MPAPQLQGAEAMNSGIPYPEAPNLRIAMACQQLLSRREGILRHFEGAGIYINGHDLAFIARFYLSAHLLLIDLQAAACVLFFAVTRLPQCHATAPVRVRNVAKKPACIICK